MNFGFIFKYPTTNFSLIYDGDPHKLRMVVDGESAKQWIDKFETNEFIEDEIEAIGKYRISKNIIPILDGEEGIEVVNKQFGEYLIGAKISSVLMRIWSVFLKKYDVVYDGIRVGFREKINYDLGIELPDGGLMRMKEFIFGLFRLDPINIFLGKDKNGNDKFKGFDIAQHYNGKYKLGDKTLKKIPFHYKGKRYETPIYGIYAPQMRELMFGGIMDFGGGRILQKWQVDFLYSMGEETYIAAARGAGKCQSGDSIVYTDKGMKKLIDIKVGDNILGISGEDKKYVKVKAKTVKEDICYRITMNTGEVVEATGDHMFPTSYSYKQGKFNKSLGDGYKRVDELKVGDFIPTYLDNYDLELKKTDTQDYKEGLAIGVMLGDGCLTTGSSFQITKRKNKEHYIKLFEDLGFGVFSGKKDVLTVGKCQQFREKYNLYGGSKDKRIPKNFYNKSIDFRVGLLEGLFGTDGYIQTRGNCRISYSSISEGLIDDLLLLTRGLGIIGSKKKRIKDIKLKGKGGKIKTLKDYVYYEYIINESYGNKKILGIGGLISLKKNYKEAKEKVLGYLTSTYAVLPKHSFKLRTVKGEGKNPLYNGVRKADNNYQRRKAINYGLEDWLLHQWSRVKNIEKIESKTVVDLQVGGDNLFYCNGILTHNSFIVAFLASVFTQRTLANPRERVDGPIVHVYGISHPSNKAIINKILRMNKKLQDGKLFKYSSSDRILYFIDNNEISGWVEFLSDDGNEPGRGGRPTMVIIDEASRISRDTYRITLGQSNIPKVYVSTINSETKKNWFYEGLVRGEIMQTQYSMKQDEAIVYLWDKYGMDEYDTLESINTNEAKKKISDMREEYFSLFPIVSRRYTIDDIEYMSEGEKRKKIRRNIEEGGMNYMLCEQYSEIMDEGSLFQYERGRIGDEEIPDRFDMIVISFDQADEFDNPAVVVGGLKGLDIYVLESSILNGDELEQMDRLVGISKFYNTKYGHNTHIYQIADCTQSPKSQKAYLEDRGWFLDVAFRITNGGGAKWTTDGFLIIGKKLLVSTTKSLFGRGGIKLPDKLNIKDGLITELEQFQAVKTTFGNTKYQAVKGKDDQVNALMFMVYFMYDFGLGDKLSESDNVIRLQNNNSKMKLIELEIEKRKREKEEIDTENIFNKLMGEYGY